MNLCYGDMWSAWDDQSSDLFLITTNSTIKSDGTLTMGAGIAGQAAKRFPGIDRRLGQQVWHMGFHGLLVSPRWPLARLGCFQTKGAVWQDSELWMIKRSADVLATWCATHPGQRVDLAFPGIGNGNLKRVDVLKVISGLPDQVNVWEFKRPQ